MGACVHVASSHVVTFDALTGYRPSNEQHSLTISQLKSRAIDSHASRR